MFFCKSCGIELPDNIAYCPICGAHTGTRSSDQTFDHSPPIAPFSSVSPVSVLVYGILAMEFSCTVILSFLGIIFGIKSMRRANRYAYDMGGLSGMAKVGRILGKLGFILGIVCTALFVLLILLES